MSVRVYYDSQGEAEDYEYILAGNYSETIQNYPEYRSVNKWAVPFVGTGEEMVLFLKELYSLSEKYCGESGIGTDVFGLRVEKQAKYLYIYSEEGGPVTLREKDILQFSKKLRDYIISTGGDLVYYGKAGRR